MKTFDLRFVGVGPLRTGTTWLHQCLQYHPKLCLPKSVKETMFFDKHYEKGLSWYAAHFIHRQSDQLCGEISPTYFNVQSVPGRIHRLNPKSRIIINLRNPVARALSLSHRRLSKGRGRGDNFAEAIVQMPGIVNSGRYALHIPNWLSTFGTDQVLFILLDDIESRPEYVLSSVSDFLGVEMAPMPKMAKEKIGAATAPRIRQLTRVSSRLVKRLRAHGFHRVVELGKALKLDSVLAGRRLDVTQYVTANDRLSLLERYEVDIQYVENLLGRDLKSWRRL